MNPLLVPVGLLLLGLMQQRGSPQQQPRQGPQPTPPPGASIARRRRPARPVLVRKGKAITAQPLRGDPFPAPKPAPVTVINDTTPVPAAQAPEQAAVDAAMAQVVRDTLTPKPAPPPAAAPAAARKRSPKDAAKALLRFVLDTGRFGSKQDRPQQIRDAQRDMGLPADGIIGPKTRAAAAKHGVALPSDQTQPM